VGRFDGYPADVSNSASGPFRRHDADAPHSLDRRRVEEVGASPQAPEAANCPVVMPVIAAGAVIAIQLHTIMTIP